MGIETRISKQGDEIQVGDRVRSFDFAEGSYGRDLAGPRASYIEGEVEAVDATAPSGWTAYKVRVERQVAGGEEIDALVGEYVYPPVNGTPQLGRDELTNFVEKIVERETPDTYGKWDREIAVTLDADIEKYAKAIRTLEGWAPFKAAFGWTGIFALAASLEATWRRDQIRAGKL
nr:hypothetical protein 10 [bacterium]